MAMRRRSPVLRLHDLVIDNFAGGGGTSLGIEWALGRSPDIAINHDAEAIAMHEANHPHTKHFHGDVWDFDPVAVCDGRPVGLAWFSPDCKHFSKAKGGKPVDKRVRGLAWVAIRYARTVRPKVIVLENVEEFVDWGPLLPNNRPDPARIGFTFRRWLAQLESCGYQVELRELRACDYGAPTVRKRLFVIARCDGLPIVWPDATHGEAGAPYRTAGECIEWSIPAPSIFERAPGDELVENSLRRIARGVRKYVLEAGEPFLYPVTHPRDARVWSLNDPMRTITGAHRGEFALAVPTLIQTSWGERPGQAPRVPGLEKPLGTVMAGGIKHALVAAFLAKNYGGHESPGSSLHKSISTITTRDHHALIAAHILKYYGSCTHGQSMHMPMATVTAGGERGHGGHFAEVRSLLLKHEPGSVKGDVVSIHINGDRYDVGDIGMRMLVPRELFRAQGFPDSYKIEIDFRDHRGRVRELSKTAQVRMCGNSVSPVVARAIVDANLHLAKRIRRARVA